MGKRKFIFVYFKDKRFCRNAEEAIEFVNGLQYGGSNLICNDNCTTRIRALFDGDIKYHPTGHIKCINFQNNIIPGFSDLATTGCSTTRIKFFPALAENLDEHEIIYQKRLEEDRIQRKEDNDKRIKFRLNELREQRKGWYAVNLNFDRRKFIKDNFVYVDCDFSGKIIAESGENAYNKTIEHLKNSMDVLSDSLFPDVLSHRFWFEFLGANTDEGYSVEIWNGWKSKGEI